MGENVKFCNSIWSPFQVHIKTLRLVKSSWPEWANNYCICTRCESNGISIKKILTKSLPVWFVLSWQFWGCWFMAFTHSYYARINDMCLLLIIRYFIQCFSKSTGITHLPFADKLIASRIQPSPQWEWSLAVLGAKNTIWAWLWTRHSLRQRMSLLPQIEQAIRTVCT